MPNRMIRDGLLESPRYWAVGIDDRQLFWHLMLLADDFGLVSLAPIFIRRRAFNDAPSQSKIDKQIAALERVDLIRTYEIGGVRYAFLPRFRQTLRIENPKHPMPPRELFEDDKHASDKFNKNREKFEKLMSKRTASAQQTNRTCAPEVEVKGSEGKRREVEDARAHDHGPDASQHERAENPIDKNSNGNGKSLEERAQAVGITQGEGEKRNLFMLRVASEEAKARSTT